MSLSCPYLGWESQFPFFYGRETKLQSNTQINISKDGIIWRISQRVQVRPPSRFVEHTYNRGWPGKFQWRYLFMLTLSIRAN